MFMNEPLVVDPVTHLPEHLLVMPVEDFAEVLAEITLNALTSEFLSSRRIKNIRDLLAKSVIHEPGETWRSLGELRQALTLAGSRGPGFDPERHYFLIIPI